MRQSGAGAVDQLDSQVFVAPLADPEELRLAANRVLSRRQSEPCRQIASLGEGRANIILLRIEGLGVEAVAERLSTTSKRVSMWSTRFARLSLGGLADEPGRGRKASIAAAKVARVIIEATRPPSGRSRWSIRSMAQHAGVSASSVQRIWSDHRGGWANLNGPISGIPA